MARQPRNSQDDGVYHVLNRGNCRMNIFGKDGDFDAYLKLLEEARERFSMRILGYCLMHNHWHLVLWPNKGNDLSKFIGWVSSTHVRRWREHRENVGEGHLYQGRFKSFLVQEDGHFLNVMRYVESNPLRAKMVARAEDWPYSSLNSRSVVKLNEWPVDRPNRWLQKVNQSLSQSQFEQIKTSVVRGRPYGDPEWIEKVAKKYHLESTLRDPWRPKKLESGNKGDTPA